VGSRLPRAASSLRYVTDAAPGIRRLRRRGPKGKPIFFYRTSHGRPLRDEATLARIRSLAIPPAYEDVWICPHPNGHLQATGRDARGRKQYRYHARWRAGKDGTKHARMHEFGRALPRLRRTVRADLKKRGLPREKVLALVVRLMDDTRARVGNAEYARTNGSFGLSTLQDRHVRFPGNGVLALRFPGKGGTLHEMRVQNPRLARLVRQCQHLPGQRLFQYIDESGRRRAVDSGQVNEYLREHLGGEFTAKDFRTWHATRRAYELLCAIERPDPCTDAACRRLLQQVCADVAHELRNTPAVCRKSYIDPVVLEAWQAGSGPFARGQRRRGTGALLSWLGQSSRARKKVRGGS
jgi:DNA topoisomerase IB